MEKPGGSTIRTLGGYVLTAHGASWLWLAIVFGCLRLAGVAFIEVPPNLSVLVHFLSENSWTSSAFDASIASQFVTSVILAPIVEEALFRFLPLELADYFGPRVVVATQVAICMMLFGWLHGSTMHIFLQGVLGLILSLLYLKGVARHKSVLAGYLCCVAAHAMYNLSVLLLT